MNQVSYEDSEIPISFFSQCTNKEYLRAWYRQSPSVFTQIPYDDENFIKTAPEPLVLVTRIQFT